MASPETGAKGFYTPSLRHWEIIAIGNQCNHFEFSCILSRNHKLVRTSPSLGIRFIENQSSNSNCPNFLEEQAASSRKYLQPQPITIVFYKNTHPAPTLSPIKFRNQHQDSKI
ncbi:hypothetical protein AVEN_13933-1 [Araneus ventricosus]|uniref:Uncharacterized protein n=1 Tax=Araneus ventricosus TaxID=182803 RepID=A0A4Y2U3F5_ARAVE|nr:hypothetical protein AVEN_13933-1 [Araneus ventricosus]